MRNPHLFPACLLFEIIRNSLYSNPNALQFYQRNVVGNVAADAARVHPDPSGVGVPRDQRRVRTGTDVYIYVADRGDIV